MRILVTGGAGFIGSNLVHLLLQKHQDDEIVNLDLLTYAGNIENIQDLRHQPRHHFVQGDILDGPLVARLMGQYGIEAVINLAAESHVDRSIRDPGRFVQTNVQGTLTLLEAAKKAGVSRFIQVSTDEVYGSLGAKGCFTESAPLRPNSPYAASKASADMLVRSYFATYGLPINITRCSNNYGPYQFPEKLIPLLVTHGMKGQSLPIYGTGENVRDWLYVSDHCQAIDLVLRRGQPGAVYNVGGHNERTNNEIAALIVRHLQLGTALITHVADRLGHDQRYAIDAHKITTQLGWQPEYSFDKGIIKTINWYLQNPAWWVPLQQRAALK